MWLSPEAAYIEHKPLVSYHQVSNSVNNSIGDPLLKLQTMRSSLASMPVLLLLHQV
jgi:hypothetical protein